MNHYLEVASIFKDYLDKSLICSMKGIKDDSHVVEIVEHVLSRFNPEYEAFLRKEFSIVQSKRTWFYGERSKSSYYRTRKKLVEEFYNLYKDIWSAYENM